MFRSIRLTLLFWYGILFLVLLGAFGITAYVRLRRATFKAFDTRLDAQAETLAGALSELSDGKMDLDLPRSRRKPFALGPEGPYFAVWGAQGELLFHSDWLPPLERPLRAGKRIHGPYRELAVEGPVSTLVLVGKRMGNELAELHEHLALLLGVGLGIGVAGLLGGWVLAGRALGPIGQISRTAAAISASNLSQRMDVKSAKSELGLLAGVLNQTLDRLQGAFLAQSRFMADASHELRTPLSVILTSTELALRKERSAEEYRQYLEEVLASAARMKGLVEGLLTLARYDAPAGSPRREALDLAALVEDVGEQLQVLAEGKKVSLAVETRPLTLVGDAERLREAVSNLGTNAVRFTPEGGKVEISLRQEEKTALLRITDTGIGIAERDQPRIFERFFRSDAARSRDSGGAGLGLAITRSIVLAHQGTIRFTSKEGAGTTFELRLPV